MAKMTRYEQADKLIADTVRNLTGLSDILVQCRLEIAELRREYRELTGRSIRKAKKCLRCGGKGMYKANKLYQAEGLVPYTIRCHVCKGHGVMKGKK